METRLTVDPVRYARMTTDELRAAFLIETLFTPGQIDLLYCEVERAVVGSAVPTGNAALALTPPPELRAEFFCQRRELGVLNIGGPGTVTVDGKPFAMANRDCLYIGRGTRTVEFSGPGAAFYLVSYPAHTSYPVVLARQADAEPAKLGSVAECNQRTIYKYIHPAGVKSCQLVMGYTQLETGSVWNTMPPHTHPRRSEVYLYFDVADTARVFHIMGAPQETRHLVVANRQAILSPMWSVHCACATQAYAFCWAMGGENQEFADMDPAPLATLK